MARETRAGAGHDRVAAGTDQLSNALPRAAYGFVDNAVHLTDSLAATCSSSTHRCTDVRSRWHAAER
jgi:hypothetical protein